MDRNLMLRTTDVIRQCRDFITVIFSVQTARKLRNTRSPVLSVRLGFQGLPAVIHRLFKKLVSFAEVMFII